MRDEDPSSMMVAPSHRSGSKTEHKLKKGNSQFGAGIPFFPCSD